MPKGPNYSAEIEQRISNCLEKYCDNEKFNIAAAAREFAVPESRLRARAKGRMSRHDRPGVGRRLNFLQDEALKSYIRRCDSIGVPRLVPQLQGAAQYLLDRIHPDGKAPPLSRDWSSRWL